MQKPLKRILTEMRGSGADELRCQTSDLIDLFPDRCLNRFINYTCTFPSIEAIYLPSQGVLFRKLPV